MEKTAKQHFKTMYQAARREDPFPYDVTVAALDAERDFGREFAIRIAIAANTARWKHRTQDLQDRLIWFKNERENGCNHECGYEDVPF